MNTVRHGLCISIERCGSNFLLLLQASGKLTHEDYQTITPLIDSALTAVEEPTVNVLVDATELTGWELRAAWDDFKIGLKHGNSFARIAIYGNKNWQQRLAKIGSWFLAGEIKYFTCPDEAVDWINQ